MAGQCQRRSHLAELKFFMLIYSNHVRSFLVMKSKLIIACSVAVAMASCSKKETAATPEEKPAETPVEAPVVKPVEKPAVVEEKEVVLTKVAESLKDLTFAIEGEKFVNKDVSNDTEYFLVYFSASW